MTIRANAIRGNVIGANAIRGNGIRANAIGAMVRGYKSAVTKQLNALHPGGLIWQRNYYEHIIRNPPAHPIITEYIINNPAKWNEDKFYSR